MSYKILIVDNNQEYIDSLTALLKKGKGEYDIACCNGVDEAIDHLKYNHADCLIFDYAFPQKTAHDFLRFYIRKKKVLPPVIILTGEGNEKIAIESLKLGAVDYFNKETLEIYTLERSIAYGIEKKFADMKETGYKDFLSTLLDTIPDPLMYKNSKGVYLGCNKAFEDFLGFAKVDIIGKTVYDLWPKQVAEEHEKMDKELLENPGSNSHDFIIRRKDKQVKHVIIRKSTFNDADGDVAGIVAIVRDITEEQKKVQDLFDRTVTDPLTGVNNRRYFDERMAIELRVATKSGSPFSLIMIDVDYFKLFNDIYGHQEGDECLKKVAQAIKSSLLRLTDSIARYGREKFSCIIPSTNKEGAIMIAERIKEKVAALKIPHKGLGVSSIITVSQGVATLPADKFMSVEELVLCGDKALGRAKGLGRNRVEVFQD
ncbi:MAG: diguanylate cyclase [Nitrospinota bacterium]|nr:diguanylate cyclase [Nitrospinota bacterium]